MIIFLKKKNNLIFSYKINLKLNDYVINYFKFKNLPLFFLKKPKNLNNKLFFKNINNLYKLNSFKNKNNYFKLNSLRTTNNFYKLNNFKNKNTFNSNLSLNIKYNFFKKNLLIFKSFFFKYKFLTYNKLKYTNTKKIQKLNKGLKIKYFNYFNTYANNTYFIFFYIFNLKYFSSIFLNKFKLINPLNQFFHKFNLINLTQTNLYPNFNFNYFFFKKINTFFNKKYVNLNFTPWYYNTLIRFIENFTGKKIIFQFFPYLSQEINKEFIIRYKLWLSKMKYYEQRLGHKFFLEEGLHILHLGFYLKDSKLIISWLKSIILRISFWKTKFIFRFLKYLIQNFFYFLFKSLDIKGFSVKLKGKISSAGNSRKKVITYKIGKTSQSSFDLRVNQTFKKIVTFTGVMGFKVAIYY